jgi:NADP-dependent 3-hydroxy acid dehydrogenase YdfG
MRLHSVEVDLMDRAATAAAAAELMRRLEVTTLVHNAGSSARRSSPT